MQRLEPIIISAILESGSAFAVRKNGGRSVYVPKAIFDLSGKKEDDEVMAVLGHNTVGGADYRAMYLDWDGRIQKDPSNRTFIDLCMRSVGHELQRTIEDIPTIALREAIQAVLQIGADDSVSSIAERINGGIATEGEEERVRANLSVLVDKGEIVHCRIKSSGKTEDWYAANREVLVKGISFAG